ncbi:MAG TPA: hypothetical protein VGY57_10180 [Vicinamibacterales bacterium]|nr:hypothetical protein [Vicinamibacterales bacterium]
MFDRSRLPDPNGRPKPLDAGFVFFDVIAFLAAILFTAFALLGFTTRTMGATRSTRLKWQERQRQVDEAVKAAAAEENRHAPPADDRR